MILTVMDMVERMGLLRLGQLFSYSVPRFLSFFFFFFIYLCLAVLGPRCYARAFSSCGERGLLFVAVRWLLIAVGSLAALVVEHRLQARGLQQVACRLSSCGAWAQLLRGMWDLPGPGLKPVSPALAGRFLTTAPPGKSQSLDFYLPFFVHGSLQMSE